jgi:hypothetical protein
MGAWRSRQEDRVSAKDTYFSVVCMLKPGCWIVEREMKQRNSLKGKISGVADTGRTMK